MPVTITIAAKTAEGFDAEDPQLTVVIQQVQPINQQIAQHLIDDFIGNAVLRIDDPDDFPVWLVTVSFSRYAADSGFFFQPRGDSNPSHTFQVQRIPGDWSGKFVPLAQLPWPRFAPLREVVANSSNVDLKVGPAVGDLNANYDTMSGNAQSLAKMALLNLFAVLSDEVDPTVTPQVSWFSYVKEIVRLDQERFVAKVDPTLFESVQTIISQLGAKYSALGFSTEPQADNALHLPNIPVALLGVSNLVQMITIKKRYEQGDVQLTLSFLRVNGEALHLLDCDMDEHDNIVTHSFDLIKHLVTQMGTHPILMHEYIAKNSADKNGGSLNGGQSTVQFGYDLV